MAEWLGRALQKLVQRFESASDLFQMIPRQRDFFCLLLQAELAQSRKEQAKKKPSAGRIIWKFAPPLTGWPKAICFRFMMYESFCPYCRLSLLKAERNRQKKAFRRKDHLEVCAPTYRIHLQQRNNTLPTSRAHSELNGI